MEVLLMDSFFPFNTGNQIFREYWGSLYQKNIKATDESINHYFGLTMSTRFVQVNGGHVETGGDIITYEFSGDDDIWVFIDDVLVADLGGIHDMASLKIDFSTGDVIINQNTNVQTRTTNLRACFEAAGVSTNTFAEGTNTFADDTYHTLKFFYLERGNTDSNMSLSFNLVSIPESSLIKVDQTGTPLRGVRFSLYSADSNYNYSNDDYIATGTTDNDGSFVFQSTDESIIHLQDLYNSHQNNGVAYFVIREENLPEGYRSTGEVKFRLEELNGYVVPLASNHWETGAYTLANANVSTGGLIWSTDGQGYDLDNTGGMLFGVIVGIDSNGNVINVTSGDVSQGYNITDAYTDREVLDIVRRDNTVGHRFLVDSSGSWKSVIEELPGDITKYDLLYEEGSSLNPEYTIRYYYSTATDFSNVNEYNTVTINSSTFKREFSANVYVPNIKNYLLVQKYDEEGSPLDGATFSLYSKKDTSIVDGAVTINTNATPFDTLTTYTGSYFAGEVNLDLNGGGVFPYERNTLPMGEYYLVEELAPTGYDKSTKVIPVIVSNDGVIVDAMDVNDEVSVLLGAGSLVSSMRQFTNEDLCTPYLKNIYLSYANGTYNGSGFSWEAVDWSNRLSLSYLSDGKLLSYGPTASGGDVLYRVDAGFSRAFIMSQDSSFTMDLSNLLSRTTTVCVGNTVSKVDIKVSKVWVDDNDSDGLRPSNIVIQLYQNGVAYGAEVTLSEENSWSYTWTELPEYDMSSGEIWNYSVGEVNDGNYNSTISGNSKSGYIITNALSPSLGISKSIGGLYRIPEAVFEIKIKLLDSKNKPITGRFNISGDYDYNYIRFIDGYATIELQEGDEVLIKNLPSGSKYSISEINADAYDKEFYIEGVLVEGEQAEGILSNSNVDVDIVNTIIDVPDSGVKDSNSFWYFIVIFTVAISILIFGVCVVVRRYYEKGK